MRFFHRNFSPGLVAVVVDTYLNAVVVTQLFKWCTAICSLSHLPIQTEGPGHIRTVKKGKVMPRRHRGEFEFKRPSLIWY
jgi:hypothetical protein